MGTIVKRKNKNAEVYTVRVRLKNLPEITAKFKELDEAERFLFEKEIWLTLSPCPIMFFPNAPKNVDSTRLDS